jgi:hypothetical protein
LNVGFNQYVSTGGSISISTLSTGNYYNFYNWKLGGGCSSGRIEIPYYADCLVGVEENSSRNNISIHPNPSLGIFTISANKPINEIEVRNIKGQLIYQYKALDISNFNLDLSDKSKGIYFIQVRNEIGVYNKKVVKQ